MVVESYKIQIDLQVQFIHLTAVKNITSARLHNNIGEYK